MAVLGTGSSTNGECFVEGGAGAFKGDLINTPHPGSILVDELKSVGAADQIVIGEGEGLGRGGVIAGGIKVIDELAVKEHLDLICLVDIEGREIEVDVVGGIRDLEAKGDRTIGFFQAIPALAVLGTGSSTNGECFVDNNRIRYRLTDNFVDLNIGLIREGN